MTKKKPAGFDPAWAEAKQRCRLNQEEIAMAKALGMTPKSLIKNIPAPSQGWKQPVKAWVRELYAKKFGPKGGKTGAEAGARSQGGVPRPAAQPGREGHRRSRGPIPPCDGWEPAREGPDEAAWEEYLRWRPEEDASA